MAPSRACHRLTRRLRRGRPLGCRCPSSTPTVAERLFRHRVIALLRDEGLLSQERIELLLSWRNSGFSAHHGVTVAAGDTVGIERLGRYLLRAPVAVERMQLDAGTGEVLYRPRHATGSGLGAAVASFAPADFLALLLQHVPEPRLHQVRYYGHYSNVARARRAAAEGGPVPPVVPGDGVLPADPAEGPTSAAERRRRRRLWAQLLRRVYEVDPLTCRECGGPTRILAFIQEPAAIRKILAHLVRQVRHPSRAPPERSPAPTRAAS